MQHSRSGAVGDVPFEFLAKESGMEPFTSRLRAMGRLLTGTLRFFSGHMARAVTILNL